MEIVDQFGNPIQNATFANPDEALTEFFCGHKSAAGVRVNEASALQIATVFACVRNISNDMGKLPWITYRRLKKRGKERADDLSLYWLLHDSPNDEMSSFTFRQTLTKDLLLGGNAYAEIQFRRGLAVAMWPLERSCMRVLRRSNGDLIYEFDDPANNFETRTLEADQVLHLRGMGDGLVGYSPIRLARETFGIARAQDFYNGSSLGNDSTPAGLLEFEGDLSDQALKRLREEFDEWHKGALNRRRMLVAGGGKGRVTFTPFEISPEDAQFLLRMQHTVEEICRWFRMPPHKAGHLLRSTNNNIEQQALEYVQDCLRDYAEIWEQEVSRKLIPARMKREIFAEFNFNDALRTDHAGRAAFYNTLFNIGALNDNDIREAENLNPYDGGDTYFANSALVPVQILANGPQKDTNSTQTEQPPAKTDEKQPEQQPNEPEKASEQQNNRIHAILAAYEPLIADVLRKVHKTSQDKVTRASKRSNFAEFAAEFYATQPKFVSKAVQPTIVALSTSLTGVIDLEPSVLDEIEAIGHRIVARSKAEMKDAAAVKTWTNGRADQEAKEVCQGIVRAMGITFTEEHETSPISS